MRREIWISLALAAVTLALYFSVGNHDFIILDDPEYVTDNPVVQAGLSKEGARWAFTTGHAANWHPLTWLSHMLDCHWFGLEARWHHWGNVILHACATVLLFLALSRLTSSTWPAALAAALFAWHPLHVESVAWVAERKDVLSGFFWAATLLCYAWYAKRPGWPGRARYLAALTCFVLGLLSKPMTVTLPFVLLLLDWWPLNRLRDRRQLGRMTIEKIPFLALSAGASVVTFIVQSGAGATGGMERLSLLERVANAAVTYLRYLGKTLWPADLAVYYPHPGTWPFGWVAASVLILAAITVAATWLGRTRRYLIVGWLWYLGTLVPVIGLVQVGSQSAADRYTYIPLTGLFLMAAWGIADWVGAGKGRRRWAVGLSGAALACCLAVTAGQIRLWRSSVVLFEHAIEATRGNIAAHVNLGHALLKLGETDRAAAQYETALSLNAALPDVHSALGLVRAQQGRSREAFEQYSEALRLDPDHAEAHNNLGFLLAQHGRLEDAAAQFREAARSDPASVSSWLNLSRVLAAQGDRSAALRAAERALEVAVRTGQREAAATIREEMERLRSGAAN